MTASTRFFNTTLAFLWLFILCNCFIPYTHLSFLHRDIHFKSCDGRCKYSLPSEYSFSGAYAALPKLRDPYTVLEVKKTATEKEIRSAFRKLSLQYHPDRSPDEDAAEKYKEITEAYDLLSDPKKKEAYDLEGFKGIEKIEVEENEKKTREANRGRSPGGFWNWGGDFMGPQKAYATIVKVRLTLRDLYFGKIFTLHYVRNVICDKIDQCLLDSEDCSGKGLRTVIQRIGPGFMMKNQIADESCIKPGKAWKRNCKACPKGDVTPKFIQVHAIIDGGFHSGDQIVFDGIGQEVVGLEPGDLVLVVEELPNESYVRNGNNLETVVEIDLLDALVGFKYSFRSLDERPVDLIMNGVTYDGQTVIMKGRGMPIKDDAGRYGDLIITMKIKYPVEIDGTRKQLIREALQGVEHKAYYKE